MVPDGLPARSTACAVSVYVSVSLIAAYMGTPVVDLAVAFAVPAVQAVLAVGESSRLRRRLVEQAEVGELAAGITGLLADPELRRSLGAAAREHAEATFDPARNARRVEEISLGEAQERDLEQRRDAARRRLREINARAIEAERLARETARRERRALARVAQSLVAALELDRYEFARQASARGASDLLVPRRRPEGGRARADGSVTPAPAPTRAAG